jgi:hypothetical protein
MFDVTTASQSVKCPSTTATDKSTQPSANVNDSLAARPVDAPAAAPLRNADIVRAAVARNVPIRRRVPRGRSTSCSPETVQPRRPPRVLQAPRASHRGGRVGGAGGRPRRPPFQCGRVRCAGRGQQRPRGPAAPVHAGGGRGAGFGRGEEGPRVRQLQQVDYGYRDDSQGIYTMPYLPASSQSGH